ncbi:hypothetical protein BOH72_14055 [Mycobacterium sp. WY10]|nr:hypothetical protein BOH72_14055 [Mycobacterium sp. WY10]
MPEPDDVEEVLVSHLGKISSSTRSCTAYRTAVTRRANDPLPFVLVRHVDGREDPTAGTADHLVSLRVLCDKALGEDAAADTASGVHRLMLALAIDLPDVYLAKRDRNASIDYLTCTQSPKWVDYPNDQILCKQSMFQVGLAYS